MCVKTIAGQTWDIFETHCVCVCRTVSEIYRVAQIKILHRTKCNFSTTEFLYPNLLVYMGEILLQF